MAGPCQPRHTEEEYERYAPNLNRRHGIVLKIWLLCWLILIIAFFTLGYIGLDADKAEHDYPIGFQIVLWSLILIGIAAIFVLPAVFFGILAHLDGVVDNVILKEREELNAKVAKMQSDIKGVTAEIKDIRAKGHVVMAGSGSIVVIGSDISNSFNALKNDDPALADALQTVSGAIEKSGNKEAGQAWERFMKQVVGERDKTTLSALWDRVVKLVPDITNLAASVAQIAPLFAGR